MEKRLTRFRRWMLGYRERIRFSQEALHLGLAGCVGMIGAGINVGMIALIGWLESRSYAFGAEGSEARILVPITIGGVLAGLILWCGRRYLGRGSPSFLEAVALGDGRLPFRAALIQGASSICSIGTGAPVGREGTITQLSATFASKWGAVLSWPPYRMRLLVACGAASGMAAAYNAPIAGAVFAAQIVLGNFAMNLFAPLVFASVIAALFSRSIAGNDPLYDMPDLEFAVDTFPYFLLPGVLCGILAALFQKSLRSSERLFARTGLPLPLRLALGDSSSAVWPHGSRGCSATDSRRPTTPCRATRRWGSCWS